MSKPDALVTGASSGIGVEGGATAMTWSVAVQNRTLKWCLR